MTDLAKKPPPTTDSEDGDALWQGVAGTVRPLKTGKNRVLDHDDTVIHEVSKTTPSDTFDTPPTSKKAKARRNAPVIPPQARPKSTEISHGLAAGVDKCTNLRLIRGQIPIEATLDLHGHNRATAHRALDAFIDAAYASGKRCVLVVTGKGLRIDTGEIGVLRQAVPDWLNGARLRPRILAFAHAIPRDGGQGALYVLLKRQR